MLDDISFIFYLFLEIVKIIFSITRILTFIDGLIIAAVIVLIALLTKHRQRYRVSSLTINLPFYLGNVTYEPTDQDRIVAWKLYTQLMTRKAALLFDEEYDVIEEVYNSLYGLFPITRDLLLNFSLNGIEREHSIVDLIFRVQNDGIRPHLTKWQSEFRRWWEVALKDSKNSNLRPQDIQKKYPKYSELVIDLKTMNLELNKYAEDLLTIAKIPYSARHEKKIKAKRPMSTQPTQNNADNDNL